MKAITIFSIVVVLGFFGYLAIKGGKIEDVQSGIFMHKSNFDKAPVEQVQKTKTEHDMKIPNYHDLKKECEESKQS